jgi:hypothetical protein
VLVLVLAIVIVLVLVLVIARFYARPRAGCRQSLLGA